MRCFVCLHIIGEGGVNGPPIAGNIKNYKKDKEQGKKTQIDPLFSHIDQELYGVSPARSK